MIWFGIFLYITIAVIFNEFYNTGIFSMGWPFGLPIILGIYIANKIKGS